MNEKFEKAAKKIYYKFPFLRPLLASIYRNFFVKYTFSGWGLRTVHELPWNDKHEEFFRKDCLDIKNQFEFTPNSTGADKYNVDEYMWRHWLIAFSVRFVMSFAESKDYNFVECGVADGMTAFFALREIKRNSKFDNFKMHLYDSWANMKKENLLKSEISNVGRYHNLSLERTMNNLSEFKNDIIYHQGYIPDSFSKLPPPSEIMYLHIDLNSAKPTLDSLNFFFPRLVKGGIIIFDDYGDTSYMDTKNQIDNFLQKKPGILLKSPTGQAIYYR